MATFAYTGRSRRGRSVSGELVADTVGAAVAALRHEQILVTRIRPVHRTAAARRAPVRRRARAKDLAAFTRQFSVMIAAGLPLVQCLGILGAQADDRRFGEVILAVRADVEGGSSLADALRRHPKVFDSLFTSMIAAGEAGGVLDAILRRLATHIEKTLRVKRQVSSATAYPAAILAIAVIAVAAILWKVIPTFAGLFAGLGADLPLATRMVIGLSDVLVRFLPLIVAGLVGLVFGVRRCYASAGGRMALDRLRLHLPVAGPLMRKTVAARFCRTLATLLASGISILEALDIAARTVGNAVVESAILATRRSIESGDTIAGPLRQTEVFPPMVVQMVAVGEATGELDAMLGKVAEFYEEEVDLAVAGLLTLLEPLMVAVLGGLIGFIVVAMYMPIFGLITQLTGG